MIRCVRAAAVALGVLVLASLAAAATTPGRIVFSATDDPTSDDVTLVRADGTTIDLSASPALDTAPVVSPDGMRVAFFSERDGRSAEWVVGIDGKNLHRVTPSLDSASPQVAWSPNGVDLAVLTRDRLYRARASGGTWVRLDHRDRPQQLVGWSRDGADVAYVTALDNVKVIERNGKARHAYIGEAARWSPAGPLAVQRDSATWRVYASSGRLLSSVTAAAIAWSRKGRLASVTAGGVLQVRAGGAGKPLLTARPARNASDPLWAGETHVLLRSEDGYLVYDIVHRATFVAPAAYRIAPAVAPDGSAYGESTFGTLVHSTLSGSTRTVASVPYCQGRDADAYQYLQVLPDGSGAVFAGDCVPPHDLFSVQADGSGLTRITQTATDEIDPSLSPDGTRIAFARDHVVWIMAVDGTGARSVPVPAQKSGAVLQDDRPSFSPDGSTLVFTRWDPSTSDQAYLCEAFVAGGAAWSLGVFGGYPAWGPHSIAFGDADGAETMTPDGADVTRVPNTANVDSGVPAWSGDGRLALLDWQTGFSILLPATGRRLALPGLHDVPFGSVSGLVWSPDGSRLAFTAADANGVGDVWTIGADGTGLTRVTHDLGAAGALGWR